MIGKDVKGSREVAMSEIHSILEKRKRIGPLTYEQQSTYDYTVKFRKFDKKNEKVLMEKLTKDYGLAEKTAVNIVNIAPSSKMTLKAIVMQDKSAPDDKKLEEIVKLISEMLREQEPIPRPEPIPVLPPQAPVPEAAAPAAAEAPKAEAVKKETEKKAEAEKASEKEAKKPKPEEAEAKAKKPRKKAEKKE